MVLGLLLASCGGSDKDSSDKNSDSTPTLSIESAPAGTSLNAASYEVSGNCDAGQGDVTVTVGMPDVSETVECTGDPGAYTALLDISEIEADSMSVTVEQGGNTKNFSPNPVNDREGPASAPTATAPSDPVGGASYNLPIVCSEAGEVVSITGEGLEPDSQTHTCTGSGAEEFSLSLKRGLDLSSSNNLMLTSTDQYGNPAGGTTTVDVPIDTIPPTVSIDGTSLPSSIEASNAQSFTVEGACSQEGQPVMVSVGTGVDAVSPETALNCGTGGSWSVILDVTSLNKMTGSISVTADHLSPSGTYATQASESVTNNFTCPENFVGVPSLTGYTTNSFCVMKYEAKNAGAATTSDTTDDTPVSQAASTPWVNINRNDSITECTDLGGKYDLITNDEWQSIARNIELVSSNWANGSVGNAGGLSTGHSDNVPSGPRAASSDDNNACHETGDPCDGSTWHSQRRTHTLSNGEVVWDIGGNVYEWVKDTNTVNYGSDLGIAQITDATHPTPGSLSGGTTMTERKAKGHFGPSGDYTGLDSDPWGGLGFGRLTGSVGGVSRGGSIIFGGVFTVDLASSVSSKFYAHGFRCVYRP